MHTASPTPCATPRQDWNWQKRLETLCKALQIWLTSCTRPKYVRHGRQCYGPLAPGVSSVPPALYSLRFRHNVTSVLRGAGLTTDLRAFGCAVEPVLQVDESQNLLPGAAAAPVDLPEGGWGMAVRGRGRRGSDRASPVLRRSPPRP